MKAKWKSTSAVAALCLGLATMPASAQGPAAQTPPAATPAPAARSEIVQNRLDQWMERHFEAVFRACNLRKANRDDPSFVPPDVRAWDGLSGRWQTNVSVAPTDSLEALFSRVYRTNAGTSTLLPLPLGLSDAVGAPLRYPLRSQSSIAHNCVSLLAASGEGGFNLSFGAGDLRAGLRYATSNSNILSAHFYSGEMLSPLSVALDDPRLRGERPRGMSRLDGLLAMWSWYAAMDAPEITRAGEDSQLYTIRDITGLAAYRVRGQNQSRLLRGSAGGGFNLLFLRAGGDVLGEVEERISQNDLSYSVAYWGQNPLALRRPSDLARELGGLLVSSLVPSAPQWIDTNGPFEVNWDSTLVPQRLCERTWEAGTRRASGTAATLSSPRTRWLADGAKCRFTVDVTPPTVSGPEFVVALALQSSIPATGTPASYALALEPPEVVIADYRDSVGFFPPDITPEFVFSGSGATTSVRLTYSLRELNGRRIEGITTIPPGTLTCGQQTSAILTARPSEIKQNPGSARTIEVEYLLPNAAIGAIAAGAKRSCSIDARVSLNYSIGPVQRLIPNTAFPRYNVTLAKPAAVAAQAPTQPTPQAPAQAPRPSPPAGGGPR